MPSSARKLLFGTAGVPLSSPLSTTLQAIERISELHLDCLEIEFVRGVKMGSETAKKIKEKAASFDIRLSSHAPYAMNLNSFEEGKRLTSQEQLLSSARMALLCGAQCVVFHAGYYGKTEPEKAFERIKKGLKEVVSLLRSEKNPVLLRLETMGKKSQFGTLEEVLMMCREIEGIAPCIDFSHIHAREGRANRYIHFYRILRKIEKKLGKETLQNLHIHISGVDYNRSGEIKHLDLKDSDIHYDDWLQALRDFGVEGMVICESPSLEEDALMLKNLYWAQQVDG